MSKILLAVNQEAGLDPMHLVLGASGPVKAVLILLGAASILVWVIWLLKWAQLGRYRTTHRKFERATVSVVGAEDLAVTATEHRASPGGRVVLAIADRRTDTASRDLLSAVARRAIAAEDQRLSTLMPTLSSIASAAPFIGLFGTVWGIMDAFMRIGVEKSASLPVVAPAIAEALIATAIGLVAAIPATIGYNYIDKRIADVLEELNASADVWVAQLLPLRSGSQASTRGPEAPIHTPAMPFVKSTGV